jgi:hypothetical protein
MSFSLFLYPGGPHRAFTRQEITDLLINLEFAVSGKQAEILMPGERMMEFITYLGCSPGLASAENDSQIFLHQFAGNQGMGGQSIETLRFPRCKHAIQNPARLLSCTPSASWRCEQCDNSGYISEINWRKSAAYADFFLEISAVFPKEAIPAEKLIQALIQFSQSDWGWFYSRSTFP